MQPEATIPKPKRRWFQIHLLTAVVATLVAAAQLRHVAPHFDDGDGALARPDEWDLRNTVSDLETSNRQCTQYQLSVVLTPRSGRPLARTLIISDKAGNELHRIDFPNTIRWPSTFIVRTNILYFTKHSPAGPGCSVEAFDLAQGKPLWKCQLRGIFVGASSKYDNNVYLKLAGDELVVYGDESEGKYLEHVDIRSGTTTSHKVFQHRDWAPEPDRRKAIAPIVILLVTSALAALLCEVLLRWRARRQTPGSR